MKAADKTTPTGGFRYLAEHATKCIVGGNAHRTTYYAYVVRALIGNRYRTERAAMEAVSAYLRKGAMEARKI